MLLHVMSPGRGPTPTGLCGAKVTGLYFSKLPGKKAPRLCPDCESKARGRAALGASAEGGSGRRKAS